MRNPVSFAQHATRSGLTSRSRSKNAPSFEEVTREIATIILVYLALALAAELLTRGLALG